MFRNYLKIAYRNFSKYRLFSSINVFGLALGFATCLIISLWVQRELSYDNFHKNVHRIFRVERELFRDNSYSRWPITSGAYKQALIDDYPEIVNAVRFWKREYSIKDNNNYVHRQRMFAVDNSVFDIFNFELEEGDQHTALSKPMSVVLTREYALKYLGTDDAIGQTLHFEWEDEPVDFKITGILRKIPPNSHVDFDMLISISSYSEDLFNDWRSNYLYTYILTGADTKKNELETKLKEFVHKRLEPHYGDLLSQGLGIHKVLKIHLVPLSDIHLHPSPNWEIGDGGSINSVYIFSSIAVLILIIACINFMNLSTATANRRAKEVSLRKTIGASTVLLRIQFIQESILLALCGLVLALILVSSFIPAYNSIFNEILPTGLITDPVNVAMLIGLTILIGILAGLYPAFYLTKFEAVRIIKGGFQSGHSRSIFRRSMVVIQFIISIILFVGTLTIYKQMQFIQTKSLGFDKENMLLLPVRSRQIVKNYQNFRDELLTNPRIKSISASSDLPGETFYSNSNFYYREKPNDPVMLILLMTDYDFVETYRMDLIAGRTFSRVFSSDTSGVLLLNEAAIKRFGWTPRESIGKELTFFGGTAVKIVGIIKDFNFRSLHTAIEPMVLILDPNDIRNISVRIGPGNLKDSIELIQQHWQKYFPDEQFEFSFLDSRINQLYENEMKMQSIFIIFSTFSIFVACLGLFGLSVYVAADRTKEIGIRKVLGAHISVIVMMLTSDFSKWVIIASIIAWPVGWYFMHQWLDNFAYKIDLDLTVFFLSTAFALFFAVITVGYQALKAALTNPVEALRYE